MSPLLPCLHAGHLGDGSSCVPLCIVQAFLISGTPLNCLEYFASLLERAYLLLASTTHLAATYIPRVEEMEFKRLKEEVADKFIGIAFDGTSRLGEAVNITARYCSSDVRLQTRLVRFLTAHVHLNNAAVFASIITRALRTELSVCPEQVACFSRDSVLVNGAACQLLMQIPFTCAENQLCITHTHNNVGSRINFDVLREVMTPWLKLVGGSNPHQGANKGLVAGCCSSAGPRIGYSSTWWYSLAEIQFFIAENFQPGAQALPADIGYAWIWMETTRARSCTPC